MTRDLAIFVALGALVAGCHCRPDPSNPDSDTDPDDTSRPVDTAPLDTGPEPACAFPEIEPNNSNVEANVLPLEAKACGDFRAPGDSDFWSFAVDEPTWLGIRIDARENGSFANPAAVLSASDGLAVLRADGSDTADVHLLFPTDARDFTLLVLEQNQQGDTGRRYFYDLIATVQKAPREWTRTEVEPNDLRADAMVVFDGDQVFGLIEDSDDGDYYRIDVPVGRHTLVASISAFDLGSPADTIVYLQNAAGLSPDCGAGNSNCAFPRGQVGFELDPWLEFTSEGDETLYLRVRPEDAYGSPVHWYVLDVTLEGESP
ncbi:MAG: hypothetical protein H6737_08265 [Alphaproteobacteria bacterium]|nr:hypothetical protein [Alphaproteobacteria bacterium]